MSKRGETMTDAAHAENIETDDAPNPAEEKAREMGWKPKEEWVGDDSGWMEADKFIERNDRLKERADGIAKEQITKLNGRIGELQKTIDGFRGMYDKAEQKAYDRAMADLKAEQREAVASGNVKAFDDAEAKAKALQKEVDVKAKDVSPDEVPAFNDWHRDNDWYGDNVEMSIYADQVARIVAPKLGGEKANVNPEFYKRIGDEVRKKFPDQFENANRKKAIAVDGDGGGKPRKKTKNGYDDLPADAKQVCDRLVKQKLLTREQYCKDYDWSE